jgi:hypothetical protein
MQPRNRVAVFRGDTMTSEEFRQQYKAYDWDTTYQPLAVVLNSGNRVYIDKPEQVSLPPEELVITRRTNPRKPERYRYADITRLVPMMELPADPGGMSYAEFDPLIRELLMADPFEPFVIELKNGEHIELNERGGTTRAGRFIAIWTDSPKQFLRVNFDQVARLSRKAVATAGKE